ncbi:MAG: hypothetical protein JNN07_16150 [Verrucomicrobiales bacterium]|nr:hypothetical protein [Verrucomicrobiales bacterium]
MPIRLNLLNEAHAAEEARRRDPVKRAVLAGVVVVSCVLGWSSILQLRAVRANSEFSDLQSQWTSMEKDYKKVVDNRRVSLEMEQKLSALQSLTTNRFLWGNVLNELQFVLAGTEGIHITRLRGEQSFQLQAEVKAKPAKEKDKEVAGRPATSTERIVVTIDAKDGSAQPGDQVAKLKATLATPIVPGASAPSTTNQVALLNISAPQSDKDSAGNITPPYVTFTIQSTYPERTRQ